MGRVVGDAAAERNRGRPGGGLGFPVLGGYLTGTAWWRWAAGLGRRGPEESRSPRSPGTAAAARVAGGQDGLGRRLSVLLPSCEGVCFASGPSPGMGLEGSGSTTRLAVSRSACRTRALWEGRR